ncbi:MAG: heavy metal-binding domain-containing protein [Lachnospiraceae bacterium]|nr:heavy metal-binding domain-containing protein [Lachnospiraceae bacterium]
MAECSVCGKSAGLSPLKGEVNGKKYFMCESCFTNNLNLLSQSIDAKMSAVEYFRKNAAGNSEAASIIRQIADSLPKTIQEAEENHQELLRELSKILITSGFTFDGFQITKYSGYISGDDAVEIPRSGIFGSDNGQKLTDALVKIRRRALMELKEAAYNLGCNAVIGVDFDYITLEPETRNLAGGTLYEPYVICVTANGNAVTIEKID